MVVTARTFFGLESFGDWLHKKKAAAAPRIATKSPIATAQSHQDESGAGVAATMVGPLVGAMVGAVVTGVGGGGAGHWTPCRRKFPTCTLVPVTFDTLLLKAVVFNC